MRQSEVHCSKFPSTVHFMVFSKGHPFEPSDHSTSQVDGSEWVTIVHILLLVSERFGAVIGGGRVADEVIGVKGPGEEDFKEEVSAKDGIHGSIGRFLGGKRRLSVG